MSITAQKIAVIGLGRVGLPFALVLADVGFDVLGIDTDPQKLRVLTTHKMPFKEDGALELLKKHGGKGLKGGTLADLGTCTAVVVCIGTFLDEATMSPNLSAVYSLFDAIVPYLSANVLLILRSTVHPNGTKVIYDYIKKINKKRFQLVYAPERISEGQAVKELFQLPQIIGSFEKSSAKKAELLFSRFAPEVLHTDTLTAELSKLVLNTYRYAKFALANELMMIVEFYGRDIYKVLALANKNYSRGGIPSPGFAAGPCLVKDSFFLRHSTPYNTLITGSYSINNEVVDYVVNGLAKRMDLAGKKIAVLGLAFKKNIDDDRGSLSLKLLERLRAYDCSLSIHDPYLANTKLAEVLAGADAVVIAVDHDEYKELGKKNPPVGRAGQISNTRLPDRQVKYQIGNGVLVCDLWNVMKTDKIFFLADS